MTDAPTFHQSRRRVLGLYFDGRYAEALAEVDEQWPRFPEREPTAYFFRMCLLCRLGDVDAALGLFDEALGRGIWWDPDQLSDADLDPARARPGWDGRLAECRRLQAEAGPPPEPVLLAPEGESAGVIVVLHGHGAVPGLHIREWEPARERGWALVAPAGTVAKATGRWAWDPAVAAADLAAALPGSLERFGDVPVALAGFSEGAALACRLGYTGAVAASGVALVGPSFAAFGAPWPGSPELRRLPTYALLGEHDRERGDALPVLDRLAAGGWPVQVDDAPDTYHEYPDDFVPYLERALGSLG